MGSSARRKQRQKIKRQKKRLSLRRAEGSSPYSKLKHPGTIEACYINEGWDEIGMANIFALKRLPGGGMAMAVYLVDLLCTGLKDAWGRIDIGKDEFHEGLDRARGRTDFVRISPEAAWRLVSGAVRFARRNGFRLPPRYERWVSVLGDPSECASADTSDFGTEDSGLLYVGTMEDLRKRLIGCTPEQFLARDDVDFISPVGPPFYDEDDDWDEHDDDDDEAEDPGDAGEPSDPVADLDSIIDLVRGNLLDAAKKWLFGRSIPPHPRLAEALDLTMESLVQAKGLDWESASPPTEDVMEEIETNVQDFLSLERGEIDQELVEAMVQICDFMSQFGTAEALAKAAGLEEPEPG